MFHFYFRKKEQALDELDKMEKGESLGQRAYRKLLADRHVVACASLIIIYILIALLGYLGLLPDFQERVGGSYELPSFDFAKIFGTDIFGRSVLYKVLAGAQTAVTMGFMVTSLAIPIGLVLGSLSGYYGGKIDALITWLYSVIISVPGILLIIAISYSLGKGLMAVCIAMAATYWVGFVG